MIEQFASDHVQSFQRPLVAFSAVFLFALALRFLCFTGLIGSDDMGYSYYAEQIAAGTYTLVPSHMALRYGVLLPVAGLYKILGASEWTTVAVPLIFSSLGPALTALLAFRLSGEKTAWIAGLMLASFPVEIRYGSILVPEPILQTFVLLGAIVFIAALNRRSTYLALLAGFICGLAYLVKEPAAFVVAAFCLFAAACGEFGICVALGLGAFAVLLGEITWYWSQSGNLLFRYSAMAGHNQSAMAVAANKALFSRLLYSYPYMMIVPNKDFGLHSVFAIAVAGFAVFRYRRSPTTALLCLWAILPWLYLNFGSSSFAYFWALPVAPRYIAIAYPPIFILAASMIAQWPRGTAVSTLGLVLIVGIVAAYTTKKTGYRVAEMEMLKAAVKNKQAVRFNPDTPSSVQQQALRLLDPDYR